MVARRTAVLLGLAVLSATSVVAALLVGSFGASVAETVRALAGRESSPLATVVLDLRLPRALSAFAVGGLLALAGAILQALLRNPLADPYVLGVSGGAAVAALVALALGAGAYGMQAASFAGALATLAALFVFARRALFARAAGTSALAEDGSTHVLLTGVMIAAFSAALLSLLLSLAPDGRLRTMVFWLLGDLGSATHVQAAALANAILAVGLFVALRRARPLNLLLRGDVQAFSQGVDVAATRRVLVLVAAVATGGAVALAGAVGFVGFVAPHVMRTVVGNDQRVLLPAATLAGGALVVVADTLARTIVAPLQLPVGVLTAMIGAPLFLWLLRRR